MVIEHGSRRLVRVAVTAHPSAAWILQQLREVVGFERAREYLLRDRDSIFARTLDESIGSLGLTVLTTTALTRHRIDGRLGVRARPVLGGLHHEYMLAPALI